MLDYKIVYRLDTNENCHVKIRIYQGDITTENELRLGVLIPVTRYRRTKIIAEQELSFVKDISDEEICAICNERLSKIDRKHQAISEQRFYNITNQTRGKILS